MIEGFTQSRVCCGEVELSVHRGGTGEPLILLHGYPQDHHCWEKVAPEFAKHFDVIVPDLRGYGDSDAPADDMGHTVYSKREMAKDIVALMDALGLVSAHILGHDRGARVSYRLALDHPARLRRLGIIEIVPTGDFWMNWNADLAMKAYHWTFLAQPYPLPENMIGADPDAYFSWTLAAWTRAKSAAAFSDRALSAYLAQGRDPAHLHAMCADYRAGATFDRDLDEADRAVGRKITAPVYFLWSDIGFPSQTPDPLDLWKAWADDVQGNSCSGAGHFVMEETPQAVLDAFVPSFRKG